MSTMQIKEEIQKYLNKADTRFIYLVYGMIKEDKRRMAMYSIHGRPLTPKQYKDEINQARKEYESGKYITQEELEKKSKDWRKRKENLSGPAKRRNP